MIVMLARVKMIFPRDETDKVYPQTTICPSGYPYLVVVATVNNNSEGRVICDSLITTSAWRSIAAAATAVLLTAQTIIVSVETVR